MSEPAENDAVETHNRVTWDIKSTLDKHDPEPRPGDGPEYHAEHQAWREQQARVMMAGVTDHVTNVELQAAWGEYLAACSCGWAGSYRRSRSAAEREAMKHVVEAASDE